MNLKDFLVYSETSLKDALEQIDINHKGLIFICNKKTTSRVYQPMEILEDNY